MRNIRKDTECYVRFGSQADIRAAALGDVRFGPIADIYMAELLVIRATRLFSIHLLILRDLLAA
jgi:hypothetical protein